MVSNRFVAGQRWLSQTEPELGLGLVVKMEPDRVTIVFPSSETTRVYTTENPPLTRVRFTVGDVLKTQDGKEFVVEDLEDKDGRVTYLSRGKRIDESRLSDSLTFSKPFDRLLNAQVDEKPVYNLRHRALYRRFKTLRAPLRGFFNGRFNPRPHQLHVAVQATRFAHPRVLLADEPGMGKLVEAALILQKLKTFGNAGRVLLLAPAELLDRTLLDLSRRFGFEFDRVTSDAFSARPAAKKAAKKNGSKPAGGPFPAEGPAWISCALEDLSGGRGKPAQAAAAAGWDVLLVAGAEALEWTEEGGNPAWNAVFAVAGASKSVILLSDAGPEQDPRSHFGRMHILDPEGYASPRKFANRRKELEPVETAVGKLIASPVWSRDADAAVKPLAAGDARAKELLKAWKDGREEAREMLIDHLLDGQEQGRFIFRNTRQLAPGIPLHEVEIVRVPAKPEAREALKEAFRHPNREPEPVKGRAKALPLAGDAEIAQWLASIVDPPPVEPQAPGNGAAAPEGEAEAAAPPAPPVALVICATRGRALAVDKVLRKQVRCRVELVTSDRRGSEDEPPGVVVVAMVDCIGRSFPGADLCVLWDTPLTLADAQACVSIAANSWRLPVLRVLLPVVEDTPQEMTALWLHQGLNAFSKWSAAQVETAAEFAKPVHDIARRIGAKHNPKLDEELQAVIRKTAAAVESHQRRFDKHRDTFLELATARYQPAEQALSRMRSTDDDESLDLFMNRTFEQLGILVETKPGRAMVVKPNPEASFRLEAIPKDGMTLCFSRTTAMVREDAQFLTWESDLVTHATSRLLSTAIGNTAYVVWEDERAQIVLLEGIYLATPADTDPSLNVSRYMPPTPVRVVIGHDHEDMSSEYTSELVNRMVRGGRREWLRNNARPLHNIVPVMLRSLTQRAEMKMRELASKASHQMEALHNADIARLKRLPPSSIRKAEIERLEARIAALKPLLASPVLSLDQLRLLRRGPSGKGI